MNWAAAIKLLRRRLFLTPAQLAALVRVDPAAVSGWEAGAEHPTLAEGRALHDLVARSELAAFDMGSLAAHIRRSQTLILLDDACRFVEASEAFCRFYKRDRSDVLDRTNMEHMLDEGFAGAEVHRKFTADRGVIAARIFNGGFDAGGNTIYTATDAAPLYSGTFGMAVVYIPSVIGKDEFDAAVFEHGTNYVVHHVDAIQH